MLEPAQDNPPLARMAEPDVPVLSYSPVLPGGMVTVGRYGNPLQASLPAAELAAEGILNCVLNGNVNSLGIPYAGLSEVELQVLEKDAERAREVLDRINADDLEPGPEPAHAVAPHDDQGVPLKLEMVAAFDHLRGMRDAQTLLASARIVSYPPPLIRRGDAPPGEGNRFLLRVAADDVERARLLLRDNKSEADADEEADLRCPKCGSWRTYPISHSIKSLLAAVGLAVHPVTETECLACKHRGPTSDFS